MYFSDTEKNQMLALKGVGKTVILRLEQLGFYTLEQLRNQDPAQITLAISREMGSTCWHNSPLARASIQAVVDLAQTKTPPKYLEGVLEGVSN
jgi:nucleotidyltransferase/DNA polymerase involved in DNA repair